MCSQDPDVKLPNDCTKNQSFILFIYCVFNSVQVPRGAPGPAASQHGPSSLAKLKQSDSGATCSLQEL